MYSNNMYEYVLFRGDVGGRWSKCLKNNASLFLKFILNLFGISTVSSLSSCKNTCLLRMVQRTDCIRLVCGCEKTFSDRIFGALCMKGVIDLSNQPLRLFIIKNKVTRHYCTCMC